VIHSIGVCDKFSKEPPAKMVSFCACWSFFEQSSDRGRKGRDQIREKISFKGFVNGSTHSELRPLHPWLTQAFQRPAVEEKAISQLFFPLFDGESQTRSSSLSVEDDEHFHERSRMTDSPRPERICDDAWRKAAELKG
jgi:hypothetical protein